MSVFDDTEFHEQQATSDEVRREDQTRASIVAYLRSESSRFRRVSTESRFVGTQRERVEIKAAQIDECAICIERRMDLVPRA